MRFSLHISDNLSHNFVGTAMKKLQLIHWQFVVYAHNIQSMLFADSAILVPGEISQSMADVAMDMGQEVIYQVNTCTVFLHHVKQHNRINEKRNKSVSTHFV